MRDGSRQFACVDCARIHYRDSWPKRSDAAMEALMEAAGTPEGKRFLREAKREGKGKK
jgi:hypothetical protein